MNKHKIIYIDMTVITNYKKENLYYFNFFKKYNPDSPLKPNMASKFEE